MSANNDVEKMVETMVGNVVEMEKLGSAVSGKMERVQVGGASLRERGRVVDGGKRWFKDIVKNVTLDLEIPNEITTHPEGESLFSEGLISIIRKYAPPRRGGPIRVGMNFSSDEILESVGLPFKEISKLRKEDIIQSMTDMSQSNKSPLQLEVPRISVRITYISPPAGSGLPNALKKKQLGGRKRSFDTSNLLEISQFGRKKSKLQEEDESGEVPDFLEEEADEGDEEEEEGSEVGMEVEEKKKRGSSNIMKNDVSENCLPHALHQALMWSRVKEDASRENKINYRRSLRKDGSKPKNCLPVFEAVAEMKKQAGVTKSTDFDWYDVNQFQNTVFEGKYQILVFEKTTTTPFFSGPFVAEDKVLVLYLSNGHFSGVRNVCNLLKTSYYCSLCHTKSRDVSSHYTCKLLHYVCGKKDCPTSDDDVPVRCESCRITFRSQICYENHKQNGRREGKSRCQHTKFCKKCHTAYYINKNMTGHICGFSFCQRCQDNKRENHQCVMAPSIKNEKKLHWKRCFFDIESRVDEETGKQIPVLFVALRSCKTCSSNKPKTYTDAIKEKCVNSRMVQDLAPKSGSCPLSKDGSRLKIIENVRPENSLVNVAEEMTEWIFSQQHENFVFVAHNASGFDGQFILEQLIASNKAAPEVSLDGSKLIYLKHRKVRLLDSLKFLTMNLAAMGKAFEIDSMKGDFPVHFIQPENYDYTGPLPADEFYALENKSVDARKKLVDFLAAERAAGKMFKFFDDLLSYCFNDVYILSSAMDVFETEFENMTNVCLLEESVTAASAAAKVFCRGHLDPLKPIVLDAKPSESINASIFSQKVLAWIGHKEDVQINISSTYGENKLGEYRVDAFIPECEKFPRGKVIEFQGCYWHGHKCTYSEDSYIEGNRVSEIREKDKKKIEEIEKQYPVEVIWECEAKEELRNNPEMTKFFENYEARDILQCARALVGGRTEVFKLCVPQDGTKYRYVDVVSLYPYVMKHKEFPVGEPENVNREDMTVPMTEPDHIPFWGFLKCKVLPPQNLLIPVIADKSTEKLVFALCKACAKEKNYNPCRHSEDERSLTGVYTTVELRDALARGYTITEVYHGVKYHYWAENDEDGVGGIFTSYVNKMMVEKIYASGWPKDVNTKEEKDAFVAEYMNKEHIDLSDHSRFVRNAGRRAVAKLMLNSLWGKMAQRVDRVTTKVVIQPSKFFKMYYDKSLELLEVRPVNDVLVVRYRKRVEALSSLKTSAMHIAAYVPAYGRLHLYHLMEKVGAKNIIYSDTDSLVYGIPPGEEDPLKDMMGEFLGQLTDEVEGEMVDFVSIGAKTYSYKDRLESGEVKTVRKAKGITLNSGADHIVTFDSMKNMVQEVLEGVDKRSEIQAPQFTMRRNRDHQVFSANTLKKFRYTVDKRRVLEDGTTVPFGYVEESI